MWLLSHRHFSCFLVVVYSYKTTSFLYEIDPKKKVCPIHLLCLGIVLHLDVLLFFIFMVHWLNIYLFLKFIYFFILLYNIELVLPCIDMNPPRMCMCSPSWIPLPPSSPSHPSGSSQCTSPEHPVSCMKPGLVIHFIYDNLHVSMPFSSIIPPLPSPTESKRLFYTSVSLLLSHIQGYHYHLYKLHIYVLVQETGIKTITMERKCKKEKWLSEEVL